MITEHTNTKTFTESGFQRDVLDSSQPVLVDFWADWCGPCHVMAPVIDELATALAGQVTVGKVNVDDEPALSVQYGIRSIPTLLLFKDGQIVDQAVGVVPKQILVEKLRALA
ncbi:MAG: thioredoxin [Candidatus Tectomicrobia bacterium]|nr:thioredoxin [Candidatus Tectomicrobia bacterium]